MEQLCKIAVEISWGPLVGFMGVIVAVLNLKRLHKVLEESQRSNKIQEDNLERIRKSEEDQTVILMTEKYLDLVDRNITSLKTKEHSGFRALKAIKSGGFYYHANNFILSQTSLYLLLASRGIRKISNSRISSKYIDRISGTYMELIFDLQEASINIQKKYPNYDYIEHLIDTQNHCSNLITELDLTYRQELVSDEREGREVP